MKILLITVTLICTAFSASAEDLNSLKQEVTKLYQQKISEFPNIKLTEDRFQEVISNLENKDKLESIYKSR